MQAVGMIAEFNPFHAGHAYALAQARKLTQADVVVVVMSGNYVQRGEPAIFDKWVRARAALDQFKKVRNKSGSLLLTSCLFCHLMLTGLKLAATRYLASFIVSP